MIFDYYRKFPTEEGERNFWSVKMLATTIDASPECLRHASRVLEIDGGVIRFYTDRYRSLPEAIKARNHRNPFFQSSGTSSV